MKLEITRSADNDFNVSLTIDGETRTADHLGEDEALCVAAYALRGEFHCYLKTEAMRADWDRRMAAIRERSAQAGAPQ